MGRYGRVGHATATAMAIAVLAIQVPLAACWTRRVRFGPAEWAWRSVAPGRPQPMRPGTSVAGAPDAGDADRLLP